MYEKTASYVSMQRSTKNGRLKLCGSCSGVLKHGRIGHWEAVEMLGNVGTGLSSSGQATASGYARLFLIAEKATLRLEGIGCRLFAQLGGLKSRKARCGIVEDALGGVPTAVD